MQETSLRDLKSGGTWLAQLVECVTLDLRVVDWSPMLGTEIAQK